MGACFYCKTQALGPPGHGQLALAMFERSKRLFFTIETSAHGQKPIAKLHFLCLCKSAKALCILIVFKAAPHHMCFHMFVANHMKTYDTRKVLISGPTSLSGLAW